MADARDFMEFYLRGKAELEIVQRRLAEDFERRLLAPDYLRLYADRRNHAAENPEAVISVEQSGNAARVITTGRSGGTPRRYRYHLRVTGDAWQIHEIQWECFLCHGTGARGDGMCQLCGGRGWKDPLRTDN